MKHKMNELYKILNEFAQGNVESSKQLNLLLENRDFSAEYKERKKAEYKETLAERGRAAYEKMAPVFGDMLMGLTVNDNGIDYLGDEILTNALKVLDLCGNSDTATGILNQLTEQYANKPGALKMIIDVCEPRNIVHDELDKAYYQIMEGRKHIVESADDAVYYALTNGDVEAATMELGKMANALDIAE